MPTTEATVAIHIPKKTPTKETTWAFVPKDMSNGMQGETALNTMSVRTGPWAPFVSATMEQGLIDNGQSESTH